MKKHANYRILSELGLILECCKGQATVEDAVNMKKDEISDQLYHPDYNIIVDFQEFEAAINADTTNSVSRFFDFLTNIGLKSKVAFLTAEPHQVVISMILKELSSELVSLKIGVFSTVDAAIRYLGIPNVHLDLISNQITELNKTTL